MLLQERSHTWRKPVTSEEAQLMWKLKWALDEIQGAITALDMDMWLGQLQPLVQACDVHGMSATFVDPKCGDTKYMCYAMCGRMVMTIQQSRMITHASEISHVTVITAEDEDTPRMGLKGINATKGHAVTMLRDAVVRWKAGDLDFQPDEAVRLL